MDIVQRKISITDNPSHLKSYRSASQNIQMQSQAKNKNIVRRNSQPQGIIGIGNLSASKQYMTRKL